MPLPILYSLRRCPYCMRARMGLLQARQAVLLRDIVLKQIPAEMTAVSPKATVPVLVLDDSRVIDQSLDIMLWALHRHDPNELLRNDRAGSLPAMLELISRNDHEFVPWLEQYKAAARYHDSAEVSYRRQCEAFIGELERRLAAHDCLMGMTPSLADYALLPFVRQFSRVDRSWYLQAPYPGLQRWLETHYQNPLYSKAMTKYPRWLDKHKAIIFGADIPQGQG